MTQSTNVQDLIEARVAGRQVPVVSVVRSNPGLAAVASKLIHGVHRPSYTPKGERQITAPDMAHLSDISVGIARRKRENASLLQMLPDLDLGFQILISSCLSPKDMVTMELIFATPGNKLPAAITAALTKDVRAYFDNTYKIKRKLPDILRNLFAISGAHIEAVIPENAIDELINRQGAISLEEYQTALATSHLNNAKGFLGQNNIPRETKVAGAAAVVMAQPLQVTAFRPMALALTTANENLAVYDIDAHGTNTRAATSPVVFTNKRGSFALEDVQVTDNPAILRNNALIQRMRKDTVARRLNNDLLSTGLESMYAKTAGKITDRLLTDMIYKPRRSGAKTMEILKTQNQLNRTSVGEPVIMELPVESVIPVIVPGQESRHVGYFVLLDDTGNPVRADTFRDGYSALADRMRGNLSQTSNIMSRMQNLTEGLACRSMADMYSIVRISNDMLEQDLYARLRNGMYANGVSLARNEDMARLMLSRMLQGQNSTILFMPAETVTYFALRYNEQGIGISLLDEMKIINSQRAVLMFANTMGGIKNSISRTTATIKFDENDPDPQNTLQLQLDALMRANTNMFPLGVDSPSEIASYLGRAQWEIKWTGHPGMPDMGVEFDQKNSDNRPVDTALEESLRKYSYAALGLTVEMVDNGFNGQTATSVVADNLLLTRRILTIQEQFNPHLTDHCQKVIRASQPLIDLMRESVKANFDALDIDLASIKSQLGSDSGNIDVQGIVIERIVADFIDVLEITLPVPDMATSKNQLEALEEHGKLIDESLKYHMSDDFFTGTLGGKNSEEARTLIAGVKAHYMRKYMADSGIMSELTELTTYDSKTSVGNPIWDDHAEHMAKLHELITKLNLKMVHPVSVANTATTKAVDALNGAGGSSSGDSGGGWGDTSGTGDDSTPEETPPVDDPFSAPPDFTSDLPSDSKEPTEPENKETPPA